MDTPPGSRVTAMEREVRAVDPAHQKEGSKGAYGLDKAMAGDAAWATLSVQLAAFKRWYTDSSNCERPGAALSASTTEGAVRAILYFAGYCKLFHSCSDPTMECLLHGELLQQYATFLSVRPCTPGTVVKVLGQVRVAYTRRA
jgi:hypothetical protein